MAAQKAQTTTIDTKRIIFIDCITIIGIRKWLKGDSTSYYWYLLQYLWQAIAYSAWLWDSSHFAETIIYSYYYSMLLDSQRPPAKYSMKPIASFCQVPPPFITAVITAAVAIRTAKSIGVAFTINTRPHCCSHLAFLLTLSPQSFLTQSNRWNDCSLFSHVHRIGHSASSSLADSYHLQVTTSIAWIGHSNTDDDCCSNDA